MKRGLTFEIPNKYGHLLGDILEPVDAAAYNWKIGMSDIALVKEGKLTDDHLFPDDSKMISGLNLKELSENNEYYTIFADLKAFSGNSVIGIETYEDFIESNCQLVLLVVDCTWTSIYCKDDSLLKALYENAVKKGYEKVEYITNKNDDRTSLIAW